MRGAVCSDSPMDATGRTAGAVIALDVGGTNIKGGLLDGGSRLAQLERRPTGRAAGPAAVVEGIIAFARELRERAGVDVVAAGVAVPGVVDEAAGVARRSVNLGWHDVPLRALLEDRLGVPVWLGHDMRAGALGEWLRGAARGTDDFLFVTIGTGIGGAAVLGGRVFAGAHGLAAELGHVVVRPDGPLCACGACGCVESLASSSALVARYLAATANEPRSLTASDIVARANAGDGAATAVWRDAIDALADGLAAAVTLIDPALVVVGGGGANAGDALISPLEQALAARLTFQRMPTLAQARLGDRAGCVGAGIAAWLHAGVPEAELRVR